MSAYLSRLVTRLSGESRAAPRAAPLAFPAEGGRVPAPGPDSSEPGMVDPFEGTAEKLAWPASPAELPLPASPLRSPPSGEGRAPREPALPGRTVRLALPQMARAPASQPAAPPPSFTPALQPVAPQYVPNPVAPQALPAPESRPDSEPADLLAAVHALRSLGTAIHAANQERAPTVEPPPAPQEPALVKPRPERELPAQRLQPAPFAEPPLPSPGGATPQLVIGRLTVEVGPANPPPAPPARSRPVVRPSTASLAPEPAAWLSFGLGQM